MTSTVVSVVLHLSFIHLASLIQEYRIGKSLKQGMTLTNYIRLRLLIIEFEKDKANTIVVRRMWKGGKQKEIT